ncbi:MULTISPECIES: carbohydrate ABC transporter permease [Halomicrobium]|uniref:Binding-protein-dependent transport systems inner membrane component n=2 Tax=Halomicrobium mukohataei TaxID=57705 RepID=C7NXN0_HALMD|nr:MULTISPECIES: sugar ABC transporter permease [Halomicrobium]ACV46468.1 binding-protein-dependent transport systems inner membrane component [Halomicrobium mukohataei DSM 12286]QCD65016.1 sugar ABC transporter permease [Halomicrobium mukohataei]QFR19822.1 ABC transporter permease subunit [Halomicrobium sp. ZPS1]
MAEQTKPFDSKLQAAALLLPTIVVLVAFLYYPSLETFRLSLFESAFLGQDLRWTGIGNFVELATSSTYRNSFVVSVLFAGVVVIGTLVLSLLISYMLFDVDLGSSSYLVAAIWPYALPPAVAAILLNFLLHPNLGIFTHYLELLTPWTLDWFNSGPQAFAVLAIVAIWKQLGYNIIFMVAALNNIPETLTESAQLDGVGRLKMLYKVYVPLISPTMIFLVVMNTIYSFFSTFPLVDLMTSGGPSGATNLLIFKLYRDAFEFSNYGLASAESVILFALVAILMYIQLRATEGHAQYGA